MNPRVEIPMDRVAEFCQSNRIRRLALFGSVLRDDFRNWLLKAEILNSAEVVYEQAG